MPSASGDPLPRATILAVDDTPANLIALSAIIGTMGVDVVTAESGALALEEAEKRDFAIILLDVMMPGMDGLETLKRLRAVARAQRVPVIFMTALDRDVNTVKQAYALGAVDYVTKPIDSDILVAKLAVFVALWQQARVLERQAEALVLKDRHMGILAHDLRTPISVVAMSAERLAEHSDPAVRSLSARISRSSTRMQQLTEDVLQFARAAASRLPLVPAAVDLVQLCRELLSDFEATHPNVDFSYDLPERAHGTWDPARLQQALSNLLTNAVKYGDGWARLRVEVNCSSIFIAVENGGKPIPPDRLGRLFQPFERGAQAQPGVGLGLFIVREIARAHGGDVEASSSEAGTVFRLRLPADPPMNDAPDSDAQSGDAAKSGSTSPLGAPAV